MNSRKYECANCPYTAVVVAGLSSEYAGDTVTHVCHDCQTLKELWVRRYEKAAIPTGPDPILTTPYSAEPIAPTCDQNPEHRIERWPLAAGPLCPQCGGLMA